MTTLLKDLLQTILGIFTMESLRERNRLLRQKFFEENENSHCQVDSWMSTKPKDEPVRPSCTINLDQHSEIYNMNHKRRGIALIFSHVNFKKLETRVGGEKDSQELAQTLKYLGFDVRVYIDSNVKTILSTVQNAAAEDHTDADCLVVAAMSHGESGVLYAADNVYPVDMLWSPFLGNRCPSLAGKPKLFFIQDDLLRICNAKRITVETLCFLALSCFRKTLIYMVPLLTGNCETHISEKREHVKEV
ncbi:caspase-like isoform X2 [Bombus pascuorum]|uniref:caspase-like isoform X2 n=1 Tax=Bombus pascuorum TaxID=65598 RepID=UPI00213413D4|nr:caspase-like isoform X2 [Bombus pascuorum]